MSSNCILHPGEIEFYVSQFTVSKLEDLGSLSWFEKHKRLQQLHQQSVLEANESTTEKVKESIVFYRKVVELVHEAITVSVWKEKSFPEIIKKDITRQPDITFPLYIILYHETTVVGLLQNILYHQDSATELGDSAVDLVDYCVFNVMKLISCCKDVDLGIKVEDLSVTEDLIKKETTITFDIGTRCVSILRYIAENLDNLPLSVTTRLYDRHDVPLLLCRLIDMSPWKMHDQNGNMYKFNGSRWKKTGKHQEFVVTVIEGQVWLALRHLLLDEKAHQHYEIDDTRRNHLLKLQRYLTDFLLDQMSPLVDLKYRICTMEMANSSERSAGKPFILEVVAEVREKLLKKPKKYWKELAENIVGVLSNADECDLRLLAKSLASAYDTLDRVDPDAPICSFCGDPAAKFCSKCKNEYYCGRECQVKAWPKHKSICTVLQNRQVVT